MKRTRFASFMISVLCTLGVSVAYSEESTITIKGSNTFGEELGPRLFEVFRQDHPEVRFELTTEGTGGGMLALLSGECDLAAASRVASEDEIRMARARDIRLRSHFIGSYGVSVIVNEANPLRGLSMTQIRDIFTGDITNWSEVDGPDADINVYIRDPVSGTYLGFQELAMEYKPYVETAEQFLSYPKITEAVKADPHGIGYTGMTLVPEEGVRALLVNGIPGNVMSVNERMYPYARGLRLYSLRGEETPEIWSFIRFVRGREGQRVLHENGFVPRAMQRMDPGGIAP